MNQVYIKGRDMFKLREYQEQAVSKVLEELKTKEKVGLIAPTGCLAGDTKIRVNRGRKGYEDTIKNLYNKLNGNPQNVRCAKQLDRNITTYVRSFKPKEKHIELHPIYGVVYSGVQKVYELTLESGHKLKATADHKIMTSNGMIELQKLTTDDRVMIDNIHTRKSNKTKKKIWDSLVSVGKDHPYASVTNSKRDGVLYRIEKHRFIYEEHHKVYVNTNTHVIHHKDFDHYNNNIDNLEMLTKKEHYKLHGNHKHFSQGVPEYSNVANIKELGMEDTYDIECHDPYNNFSANGMIVSNSGKTEMFCATTYRFLMEHKDSYVLILSHLSILTKQTKERFNKRFPNLKVGILQADQVPDTDCDVVISTMQTARNEDKIAAWEGGNSIFGGSKRTCGLVIIDEAHMLMTESYDKILDQFNGVPVVGCTATPYRSAQAMTKWFDCIAFSISIQDLIEAGHLVEPKLNQIISDGQLESADRIAKVVELYKRCEDGNRAIVFLRTIEEAKDTTASFIDNKVKAATVTSDMTDKERDETIEQFQQGNIKILTTCNVLSLGFDCPPLEVIFMPYATTSPTLYLQRIGRALRMFDGKTEARIYLMGDAPSIKKGMYEKVQDLVLLGGRVDKDKANLDIYDELEYLEMIGDNESESYKFTRKVVDVAKKMKDLGRRSLENLVKSKQFPSRFLNNSKMFMDNVPRETFKNYSPMTEKQKQVLSYAGFTNDQLEGMNLGDASMLISTVNNMRQNALDGNSDVIPSGKYLGKRVSELPYHYKQWCCKNSPNSVITKLIKKYDRRFK